jgi:hypothetical protein
MAGGSMLGCACAERWPRPFAYTFIAVASLTAWTFVVSVAKWIA